MNLSAVNTIVGVFDYFRDSIILHRMEKSGSKITFYINVRGRALTLPPEGMKKGSFEFSISFSGVVSFFNAEYDTYEALGMKSISNFEEIIDSDYIKQLPIRKDWAEVKHYRLWTYDDVFDILATDYSVEVLKD